MVNKLIFERNDDDDFTEFIFEVDGYEINYCMMFFQDKEKLKEYDEYDDDFFDELPEDITTISEIDWDFNEEYEDININLFKVIKYIDEIGKIYITEFKPSCVIFDAIDEYFSINKKLFERFGYSFYQQSDTGTYIFIRNKE